MLRYIYDGSFDGFLTAVYESYYKEMPEEIVSAECRTYQLLFTEVEIETQLDKANKVRQGILTKISKQALEHSYKAFLSEDPQREMMILYYLKKGFKIGFEIDQMLADSVVQWIHTQSRRVSFEAIRFEGFVRFRALGEVLCAQIEPHYDILELLGKHFADRLPREKWMILDKKREKALMGVEKKWWIQLGVEIKDLSIDGDDYEVLWKMYFENIAIKERTNLRQQRQFMPKKYWKNIIEME